MPQTLKITSLTNEDIKFLKTKLKKSYLGWLIFSLFSVVFPAFCIYAIITNDELEDKGFLILIVLIIFGLWIYLTIRGILDTIKEQQNLLSQTKIEGDTIVLEKEIVTIEGHESDSTSHQIKIYSAVEEKHKSIWINQKYYEKIQIGDSIWIEYFLDCNYIKTLRFDGQNIKSKTFR
ncbi:hypothetical protein [Flavobacterium sp. ACN6]|uniref:hypothetical protein n=1 Tax=Flavobacterium sp. ACN6 TaxID=1920426 RepID=UPI000BB3128C|nr:hypothetical protein [Flavobacterium sp. ACN6]PBJ15707.1 hypothetical protein BSF42_01100 [Flavobacterium sp. ACN6]